MKRGFLLAALVLFWPLFLFAPMVSANDQAEITVNARVVPHTYLVVDESGKIIEIYNNSTTKGQLGAFAGSLTGPVIAISDSLKQQYEQLEPQLNFIQGTIYKYQEPKEQEPTNQDLIKKILPNLHVNSFIQLASN